MVTTLGEFLRQEREKRGITIEQVASATKIGVRTLHLIETDNYQELPAKPFVRGFVMSYARFVGLDPQDVITRFREFLDDHATTRPTRDSGHSGYVFERREGEQTRTMLWIVLGGFAVMAALAFIFLRTPHHHRSAHIDKLRSTHESPTPDGLDAMIPGISASPEASPQMSLSSSVQTEPSAGPSPAPSPVASPAPKPSPSPSPKPSPSPSPSPSPKPSPSPSPSPSPKPSPSPSSTPTPGPSRKPDKLNSGADLRPNEVKYKIVFKTSDDIWVRYQVDQKPPMKFVMRKDKVLVLKATTSAVFQTSNPDVVTASINNQAYKPLGQHKGAAKKKGDLTLVVPSQLLETVDNPFPGQRVIQGAYVPLPSKPSTAAPDSD